MHWSTRVENVTTAAERVPLVQSRRPTSPHLFIVERADTVTWSRLRVYLHYCAEPRPEYNGHYWRVSMSFYRTHRRMCMATRIHSRYPTTWLAASPAALALGSRSWCVGQRRHHGREHVKAQFTRAEGVATGTGSAPLCKYAHGCLAKTKLSLTLPPIEISIFLGSAHTAARIV